MDDAIRDDPISKSIKARLWDLPVRLFHLAIIGLVGFSWYTAENMHVFTFGPQDGLTMFEWHVWSGTAMLVLVMFRVLWGVWGSGTARFSQFVKGPGTVWRYVTGKGGDYVGHNPLGALSVLLILGILGTQATIGLMSSEDTFGLEGPLKHLVAKETSYNLAGWHDILFQVLQVVLALHILAALYYTLIKKDNLIAPMITGKTDKTVPADQMFQPGWRAVTCLLLAGLIVWYGLDYLSP